MAITLNPNRQQSCWATVDISYADLVSGAAQTAIQLPVGAVVVGGAVVVKTAFNSATSDVIVVGDSASANRYRASVSIASAARQALTATGYETLSTTRGLQVTWTGSGTAPSAGALRLEVEYIVPSRGDAIQD